MSDDLLWTLIVLFKGGVYFLFGGGFALTYCQFGVGYATDCTDATLAANTAAGWATVAGVFALFAAIHWGWSR